MKTHSKAFIGCFLAVAGIAAATPAIADTVRRISQRDGPVLQGDGNSRVPQISANGNYVVFISTATNLPSSGPVGGPDMVLVKNLTSGSINWLSQRGDSEPPPLSNPRAIGGVTSSMCINNSGQPYWENSGDNNTGLDPCPDSNGVSDIYFNGSYSPAFSSTPGGFCGTPANGGSFNPAIAWDGTRVAFESNATNFGPADTNGKRDIYMRTAPSGAFVKASFGVGGVAANNDCFSPSVSSGGTFVAYASTASNLVAGDVNGMQDIFVANFSGAPVTQRVSVSNLGAEANGTSSAPSISSDGRYIAFVSTATNLVTGDSNGVGDVFVRDRMSNLTTRVSVGAGGAQANAASLNAVISGDGRYIAFASDATNLVAGDTNGVRDVFLHDRSTAATTRISVTTTFAQADAASDFPSISADGRRIAFSSTATNIVPGDSNGRTDVFLYTITPPPANDSCGSAIAIGLGDTPGTTLGALAGGTSSCGLSASSPDVYYTFTPTRSAFIRLETITGDYDTVLSVHSGCPATLVNQIACDDDGAGVGGLSLIGSLFVSAGVPLTVRISGFDGVSGNFTLRLSEIAPPNDLCAAPVVMTLGAPLIGTNAAAGNEGSATCQTNSSRDVYYKFTPTCTAAYTFATTGPLDTVVSVHTACPTSANNAVGCDDDSGPGVASLLTVGLTANTPYWIRVAGFNGNQGEFGFSVTNIDSLNDECVNDRPITAGQYSFNNCTATPVSNSLNICSVTASHDLWFSYISTDSAVPVVVSTGGSSFDTVLAVYNGCPGSGGVQLACNDDFNPPARPSLVRVPAPAGSKIYIQVAGFFTNSGNGLLTVGQCLADVASAENNFPDGIVDGNDYVAFINSFSIGDVNTNPVADVNSDGIIDGSDYVAFINAFAAGC